MLFDRDFGKAFQKDPYAFLSLNYPRCLRGRTAKEEYMAEVDAHHQMLLATDEINYQAERHQLFCEVLSERYRNENFDIDKNSVQKIIEDEFGIGAEIDDPSIIDANTKNDLYAQAQSIAYQAMIHELALMVADAYSHQLMKMIEEGKLVK